MLSLSHLKTPPALCSLSASCFKVLLPEEVVVDRVGSAQTEQNQMESLYSKVEVMQSIPSMDEKLNSMGSNHIKNELEEMQSNPSDDLKCLALKGNIYDWQFAIRGPNGTEFEGGIYHGRIQFSEEYPKTNPKFTLLTENGRFKTQTEINFYSIFFKEMSVRQTLLGLIELLPTYPDGALGSVEYDKDERRALAIKSRAAPPKYGTAERQKLIDEIHEYMLSKAPPVPSNRGRDIRMSSQNDRGKRKRGKSIQFLIGNRINANNSNQVGIFDFDKSSKKAKQDVSRESVK